MKKTHTCISINPEILERAKDQGIIISHFIEDALRAELMLKDQNQELINSRISELSNQLIINEKKFNEQQASIKSEIDNLKNNLSRIKTEEAKINRPVFDELKHDFKKICVDKGFVLSPLVLKTWRGMFFDRARVKVSDAQLYEWIDEWRSDVLTAREAAKK